MSTVGWHLLSRTLFSFITFLPRNLLYRAARIANFEGILGFSVQSIILVKAGLRQITM